MRLAPLIVAALLGAPVASAAGVCAPIGVGFVCAGAIAGTSVGADVVLFVEPVATPSAEWRSAHVVAGPNGAGAALRGSGAATGGPFDAWAGASAAGPYAGSYFCVGLAHYVPSSCGDAVHHAYRAASLLP